MIVISHHPIVQQILHQWRQGLPTQRNSQDKCEPEHLRALIAVLEKELDAVLFQRDNAHDHAKPHFK